METKDCNGVTLENGDSVLISKDLNVKGCSLKLKRGTVIKKIRLTDDTDQIECKIGASQIVLKTCFVKKA